MLKIASDCFVARLLAMTDAGQCDYPIHRPGRFGHVIRCEGGGSQPRRVLCQATICHWPALLA